MYPSTYLSLRRHCLSLQLTRSNSWPIVSVDGDFSVPDKVTYENRVLSASEAFSVVLDPQNIHMKRGLRLRTSLIYPYSGTT
jgi:hypothetical protein